MPVKKGKSITGKYYKDVVLKKLKRYCQKRRPATGFKHFHENICCGYSLEVPQRSTANEYPQHMFSWRNEKNINTLWLKKKNRAMLTVII